MHYHSGYTIDGVMVPIARTIEGTAADFLRDGHDQTVPWLSDCAQKRWRTQEVFCIGRGWSATRARLERIRELGGPILCINDYPEGFSPDMYCTGDPPHYFARRIWLDQTVMKFACMSHKDRPIPWIDAYETPRRTPSNCPNTIFYHHICNGAAREFLSTPWVNWGTCEYDNDSEHPWHESGTARSSMLPALRILYHMGFKRVRLLGCDFSPHEHPNPGYYNLLNQMMMDLRPVFERCDFDVVNCEPDSHLRAFDFVPFDQNFAERKGRC